MTQVIVRWDDADWALDTEELTMAQAFVIKDMTKDDQFTAGRNIGAWELGLKSCEPGCVRGLYWLMLQQNGMQSPITAIPGTFPVVKFHRAWATAAEVATEDPAEIEKALAEVELVRQKLTAALEQARAKQAPDEEAGPTRPADTESARSPGSGSSTARKHSAAARSPREPQS